MGVDFWNVEMNGLSGILSYCLLLKFTYMLFKLSKYLFLKVFKFRYVEQTS